MTVQGTNGVGTQHSAPIDAPETMDAVGDAGNVMLLVAATEARERSRRVSKRTGHAMSANTRGAIAATRQQEAVEKAREAREAASGLFSFASELGVWGEILTGAAAVVGAAATGGVGAVVVAGVGVALSVGDDLILEGVEAVAGEDLAAALGVALAGTSALMTGGVWSGVVVVSTQAAQLGVSELQEHGHLGGTEAMVANLALGVGGGALGAAAAGSGSANQANETVTAVVTSLRLAGAAQHVAAGVANGAGSVMEHAAAVQDARGRRAELEVDQAQEDAGEAVDDVRRALSVHARVMRRVHAAAQTRAETMTAILEQRS